MQQREPAMDGDLLSLLRRTPREPVALDDRESEAPPALEVPPWVIPSVSAAQSLSVLDLLPEAASDLRRRLNDLEQEVEQRRTAESERDATLHARAEFLARMSHEIRTPLQGVIGMAELLHGTALTNEQQSYVTTLRASARGVMAIVNDVLDFSKLQADAMQLEAHPFDLYRLVRETVDLVRPLASDKPVVFRITNECTTSDWFVGDRLRLQQVLVNFLSNAAKFTSDGSIEVRLRQDDSHALVLEVTDTGVGIPEDRIPTLLHPFTQADPSTTRRFGGTGLGLAIARELVSRMHGAITIKSAEGVGSTFSIRLPLPVAGPGATAPDASSAGHSPAQARELRYPSLRVLVVDDNATNLEIARMMLEKLGQHVTVCSDSVQAVEAALRTRFDLILMDIHMPNLDGFAATREIKRGSRHRPLTYAMTASVFPEERADCDIKGMDGVLPKPFTFEDLAAVIGAASERAGDVEPPAPPHAPTDVDLDRVRALVELDAQAAKRLVATFAAEAGERITTMERALAAAGPDDVRGAAHSLKGIAANLGATRLARMADEIEELAREQDAIPARAQLGRLRMELNHFLDAARAEAIRR